MRVLDFFFPNCFQCFHLSFIVSLCAADVLFFRIKRIVAILFNRKYFFCALEVERSDLHYKDFFCNTAEQEP